jgi:hypothetical protein
MNSPILSYGKTTIKSPLRSIISRDEIIVIAASTTRRTHAFVKDSVPYAWVAEERSHKEINCFIKFSLAKGSRLPDTSPNKEGSKLVVLLHPTRIKEKESLGDTAIAIVCK